MIYYNDLWDQVIERTPAGTTEVKILSGYVGPSPINALHDHPDVEYKVVFGLFKENRKKTLHDELVSLHGGNVKILYPDTPAHSKCYVWLNNGVPIKAMIGSANFSSNGLRMPFRESLLEVDGGDAARINDYADLVIGTCRECTDVQESELQQSTPRFTISTDTEEYEDGVAKLSLLDRNGGLPELSGINWGMSTTSHVNPDDAYIPIRREVLANHPELFAPRITLPEGVSARGNSDEVVELIWDDGTIMQVKFEGTQNVTDSIGNAIKYPKQISSFPNKSIMGRYLRGRLGVGSGVLVEKEDLERYGTTAIRLSKLSEGVYMASFAANQDKPQSN